MRILRGLNSLRLTMVALLTATTMTALATKYTVETVPNVQVQNKTRYVTNPDSILSVAAQTKIDSIAANIRTQTTAQVAVVMVSEIDSTDADDFATELFEKWGIGAKDKDNGLLILVVKDAHKYVFRVGYGLEGTLPDVVCARVGRKTLKPAFVKEDYDGGMISAMEQISEIILDPAVRDEIMSQIDQENKEEWLEIFYYYIGFCAFASLFLAVMLFLNLSNTRNMERHSRYNKLKWLQPMMAGCSLFFLALPLPLYLFIRYRLKEMRDGEHLCPNCGTRMNKLDEVSDNAYLTPSQDAEERINSVDYDVWLCPNCGETDIYSFENTNMAMIKCERCAARTAGLKVERVLIHPTERTEGRGVKEYECLNCHHTFYKYFNISKVASGGVFFVGGGGGRSGFGGGSFGGGFGGGSTGGGGASGGW